MHAREELGITDATTARPLQAALASAAAFAVGAALPVVVATFAPTAWLGQLVIGTALVLLVVLGALAARVGGAPVVRGAFRVALWGALAMGASALVGRLVGTPV